MNACWSGARCEFESDCESAPAGNKWIVEVNSLSLGVAKAKDNEVWVDVPSIQAIRTEPSETAWGLPLIACSMPCIAFCHMLITL